MNKEYSILQIALNFLPLDNNDFSFPVYVKPYEASSNDNEVKSDEIKRYRLPSSTETQRSDEDEEYVDFYVSLKCKSGFEKRQMSSYANNYLTQYLLYWSLKNKCLDLCKQGKCFEDGGFRKRLCFIIGSSKLGHETVWLEPYFLHKTREHGFLIGYHFKVNEDQPFNREILKKSLSLNSDGRENINYYVDNFKKLENFLSIYYKIINPITITTDVKAMLIWPSKQLHAHRLDTKSYIFADDNRDSSQFQGIKKYGPLQPISDNSLICFMYQPKDKPLSYDLYHALKGDKYATFPGMMKMFSFSLSKDHVMGIPLDEYDANSIDSAVSQVSSFANSRPVLPLILFPWSRLESTPESIDAYYRIKYQFLAKKMPTQFVSLPRIRGRDGLKWSISNVGLAVFSKLGGKPWKLATNHDKCLIIGIGQAHRRADKQITRFFAYSVLSDSSGLFDSIKILSESEDKDQYLNGLSNKIKSIINELSERYDRFVIHTPFKLKFDEMEAIKSALDGLDDNQGRKTFVVMKFDDNSKYFGYALENNSKVPYESSYTSLGKKEYLVWFEGLQYHNPTIRRRIARPMHIEFVCSNKNLSFDEEKGYLQDAINLSGANWRGFNAKTLPVSIYYAKLIAEYIREFNRLGLPEINIENLPPWFL